MSKIKIAIQGELGAYSHIATENLFKDAEIKTCTTFEETFEQAYKDPDYKIVIPLENSGCSIFFPIIRNLVTLPFSSSIFFSKIFSL